ncbi:MAG TPA: hypothetical protein VFQ05_15680 [Candidatus Eisenbacteria bacterium]|nr:hypothetical protein [Candidatus Eisenbacteria bacterium]
MKRSPHMLRRGIVVLVALIWTTSAFAATQFVTQTIQSSGNVGQFSSLALSAGEPRIGYWGGVRQDLNLASRSGGVWTVETADSTRALGLHTSLAAMPTGDVRISYYDATNGDLKLAARTAGVWSLEAVDTVGNVGLFTSIEVNGAGEPRVSYYDRSLGDLKYASRSGGAWTIETVDAGGDVGSYTSLALDGGGNPAITYWDAANGDLKLARKSGGSWSIETVDPAGTVGEFSSLALDGSGNPHVSYFDRTRGRLKLAVRSGGGWTLETIPDTLATVGQYTSLALNALGDARISYFDVTNADLRYARWLREDRPAPQPDTAYWTLSQVEGAGNVGQFSSLQLDAFDDPWIAYWDASTQNLRVARDTVGTGTWFQQLVESAGDVGQYASLVISAGTPRISYWDSSRQDLKLATQGLTGSWSIEIVDDGGNVGQFTSLALSAQGDPFLSYWDNTYGAANLKVASRVGGVWSRETIDSGGDVGRFTSIAVNAQGDPRVAYYDATNGDLKFAIRTGTTWALETIDAAGDVGRYVSLVLSAQGDARVSYYDATAGDLKFATRGAAGGWTPEVVDGTGDVGQFTSLALDSLGEPRISYYDVTNGDLKYASRSGAIWTLEVVDGAADVGQHTSLALARGRSPYRPGDATGDPRITYYDVTTRDFKFASRTAGQWTLEAVDTQGDVGQFTSIKINDQTNVVAAYFDVTNADLKLATQHYPDIALWAYPGAFRPQGADSVIQARARTTTLRWLRDPMMESRPDFGGYRIYRVFYSPDTTRMELIRRFSVNPSDSLTMWHFPRIDLSTPLPQRVATFVDPDSSGAFFKRCRRDSMGQCYSPGDSIIVLMPPPGPHDGFRTWYAITYEGRNILSNDYLDMHLNDAIACVEIQRSSCPNLNHKARNVTGPVEPTVGPKQDLQKVSVVPNPFRASEVWDTPGGHEVHFINLPTQAKIRIYTVAGDLVAILEHNDPVRDFERWNLKNGQGRDVSSGIYIYRVEATDFFKQDRFIVIR